MAEIEAKREKTSGLFSYFWVFEMKNIMKDQISKSVEFNTIVKEVEYNVKALIISAPEDIEIKNIDMDANEGYVFIVPLSIHPLISKEIIDTSNQLIFIIGENEADKLGYLINCNFHEIKEVSFVRQLKVNLLEVLMIAGNEGHFKS
jgi:hypothetical protein